MTTKSSSTVALAIGLAPLLVGCGRSEAAEGARASTYAVAYCCDEYVLSISSGENAQFLVFSPLFAEDERTGEYRPRLARSWDVSEDYRTWTFHLRTDAKWHDGAPVTARDVVFTANLLTHPSVGELDPEGQTVEAPDDSTVVVRYPRPDDGVDWVWYVVYPEHLLKGLDPKKFATWDFWTHPVGSGPYRYVRHVPKTMMESESNPDYVGGEPAIQRLVLKFSGQAGLSELLSGNVDALQEAERTHALRLERDPRFRVYYSFNWASMRALFWRHDHPLFQDARVRRALTLAIDRRGLLRVLDLPAETPLADGLYTRRQFRRGELPPALPYDPEGARRLLAETGWRDTDGDGTLDRDGEPFRFTLLVPDIWYGDAEIAVFVQDQLRRAGVQVDLQPLDHRVLGQRVRDGDYEAALSHYGTYGLQRIFGDESRLRYDNPRFAELIRQAKETVAPDELERLYGKMNTIYRDDQPVTPLFPLTFTSAAHRRVKGLENLYVADVVSYADRLQLEESP
jgi:peptide/nickel transport system substrate-binding protein